MNICKEKERAEIDKIFGLVKRLKATGFPAITRESFKSNLAKVAYLFETEPSTKGDDNLLMIRYWTHFSNLKFRTLPDGKYAIIADKFEDFIRTTHAESITRAGRKWREYGYYQPSIKTNAKRQVRESTFREMLPRIYFDGED